MTALLLIGAALAAGGLAATYLVYPIGVVAWGWWRQRSGASAPPVELREPRVSVIVIAFNEESSIRDKIENTLALDWPADRLEMIVASDGSTDATEAIVESFPDRRVRLVRNPGRSGKTATTALAVEAATGEVLVFSDATGVYNREALRELIAPLADPGVGAVSGRVIYEYGDSETARGFRLYQAWVVAQRRAEPGLHTLTSVSGSIHAMRREVFRAVPSDLSYDMVVPALVAMCGLRIAYAAGATSLERSREAAREEFGARVRIAVRAYSFLQWLLHERAEVRDPTYLVQLFLHKVLRWFSVHLMVLLLLCHIGLATGGGLAALLLVPHVGLWALAGLVAALEGRLRFPGSAALLLFATVNAAYAVGFARWLRGARLAAWTPEREAPDDGAAGSGP